MSKIMNNFNKMGGGLLVLSYLERQIMCRRLYNLPRKQVAYNIYKYIFSNIFTHYEPTNCVPDPLPPPIIHHKEPVDTNI